jgi:Ca-activated chloride channel family protein
MDRLQLTAMKLGICSIAVVLAVWSATPLRGLPQESPRFTSGTELVHVTATVTDRDGHFVGGLRKDDFSVFDNDVRQEIAQFRAERSPVSLGILLDTSGSMTGERLKAAQVSIDRLVSDRLDKDDELFFIEFGYSAILSQEWTTDHRLIRRAVADVRQPTGDTAMYDAIALALPTAQGGQRGKKALLLISDGNDTHSVVTLDELRERILDSDVLVYAIGIDVPSRSRGRGHKEDRLDAGRLRQITDGTGGRTEVIRGARSLDAAIAQIADELSHQYSIGYSSNRPHDGKRHPIRVETSDRRLIVRARNGYNAP